MKKLLKIASAIDRANEWLGKAVSWLVLFLVLIFCYDVLMRYVFKQSSALIFELEWQIFSVIFLIGAGYGLKHESHVRVDVFYANFSPKGKAWVNLIGTLFLLLPFCAIIIKHAWFYSWKSLLIGEGSPDPGGLPYWYPVKFAIPIGFLFLLLQGFSMAITSLAVLLEKKEPENIHPTTPLS